jgi:hypothetical protein
MIACRPDPADRIELGEQCLAIPNEGKRKIATSGGNGEDPGVLGNEYCDPQMLPGAVAVRGWLGIRIVVIDRKCRGQWR